MESIASSYGLALFEIAKEDNNLSGYKKDLDFISEALDLSYLKFFNQKMISQEERISILEKCFKESVQPMVLNFLKLLVVKGRMTNLFEIIKEYKALYNEALGIVEGVVYSTISLTDEQIKNIETVVSKREGKTVLLTSKIDESLIGGIKVVISDHVYDGSVKNKITSLQSELLKGK